MNRSIRPGICSIMGNRTAARASRPRGRTGGTPVLLAMSRAAIACSVLALGLVGCGQSEPASSNSTSTNSETRPANAWLLASAPADAANVIEAKASAQEGRPVVVRGRIGGRKAPISADSSAFVIVDLGMMYCGQTSEEDGCRTPWDYCCDTPGDIAAHSATVQLVDEAGNPLDVDPIAAGLSPLDEVTIVGTVGPRPNENVLTIRATGVHRSDG